MALSIAAKVAESWYTPPSQKEADNPAEFLLRPLTQMQFLEISIEVTTDDKGDVYLTAKGIKAALLSGVANWRNVMASNGEKVPFTKGNLMQIPAELMGGLASEIMLRNTFTGDDAKNS